MTGTLGLFSLVDLFQLLAASSRTGRLTVDHPEGTARVYFDEGRVVHAEFADRTGEEAVFALFADEQGSFEFLMGLPSPRTTIEGQTENLVLEATRRIDEARRNSSNTVDVEAVPTFAENGGTGNLALDSTEVGILRLVDGRRSVGELAKAAGVGIEIASATVQRMVDAGALELSGRRPRIARLVTRLAAVRLPHGTAGVDPSILHAWQKALGHPADAVLCRRADGKVITLAVTPVAKAGPFLMLSRDTLMRSSLTVNQPMLVRPAPREPGR